MSKEINRKQTSFDPRSGIILKGISEVLDSIRKNIPSLDSGLNEALNACAISIKSGESSNLYSDLSMMAKFVNKTLSSEASSYEEAFLELSSKLSLFENQLLSDKERESLLAVHRQVKAKEISIKDAMKHVGEILVDITDNSKALTKRNFGEQKLKEGFFSEGTEKVLQADLAVATRRLGRDLDRLSSMLIQQHPEDKELTSLRGQVLDLKTSGTTKFFEAIDVLSRLTWAIYRINNNRIDQDREDLKSLANSFKNFASGMTKTKNLNDEIASELKSFEDDFAIQMKEIQNSGNSAKNLVDLKAKMMANIEKLQKRTIDFAAKQQDLISEQKSTIEQQSKTIAVANKKLTKATKELTQVKSEAKIDNLSKLGNRKCYDEAMMTIQEKWSESKGKKQVGLILVDIDFFKNINDTHGHQIGDEVISWMGTIINYVKKRYPSFNGYRYGGEEFAIIAEDATPNVIMGIAKWINRFLKEKRFRSQDKKIEINITASIGVAFFIEPQDTYQSVFFHADKALYRAKNGGRDQVWVSRSKDVEAKLGPLKIKKDKETS